MTSAVGRHVAVYRVGGRRFVVCTPTSRAYGHTLLELMHGFAVARQDDGDVVAVDDGRSVNPWVFRLEVEGHRVRDDGPAVSAVRALHEVRMRSRLEDLRTEIVRELGRRTRERRPKPEALERVRNIAGRMAIADGDGDAHSYFRRDLLEQSVAARLPAELDRRAAEDALRLGVASDAPIVCVHAREGGFKVGREQDSKDSMRSDVVRNATIENYFPACDRLVREGYTIVRVGDPTMHPVSRPGWVDLATSPRRSGLLELYFAARAELLLVGESGPLMLGYLFDIPVLCVDATEPISAYPIRADGLMLAKHVIERATGRELALEELMGDHYVDNVRDPTLFRFRENTPEEIDAAVQESLATIRTGPRDTERQARFRDFATGATLRQRERKSYVRKWGTDCGFLGHGRVVDFQLEAQP